MRIVYAAAILAACRAQRPSEPTVVVPAPPPTDGGAVVETPPPRPPMPPGAVPFVASAPPANVAWPTARWSAACPACAGTLDEPTCRRCGGRWQVYMLGGGACACPTDDAGKPCRDERDCLQNECALRWEEAIAHGNTQCNDSFCIGAAADAGIPWGACKPYNTYVSCHGWITTVNTAFGVMRETRWICRD